MCQSQAKDWDQIPQSRTFVRSAAFERDLKKNSLSVLELRALYDVFQLNQEVCAAGGGSVLSVRFAFLAGLPTKQSQQ